MPEVVEIRKYADFLNKKLKNKKLNNIKILKGRYKTHEPFDSYYKLQKLLPTKVLNVKTKGKFLYIVLENDYYIFSTLGLHGGWVWLDKKFTIKKENKENNDKYEFNDMLDYVDKDSMNSYYNTALNNLNVQFVSDKGSMFYFDSLSFGTIKVIKGVEELNNKLSQIGPDIMEKSTTLDIFKNRFEKNSIQNKPIGIVLMNQKIVSGIGNYLRADVLWMSKISPFRKVKDLTNTDLLNIYNNSRALTWSSYNLNKGIRLNIIKSNIKTPSDYKRDFFVYYSDTDIYGNKIIKEELYEGNQKRFIYWVKKRQI